MVLRIRLLKASVLLGAAGVGVLLAFLFDPSSIVAVFVALPFLAAIAAYVAAIQGPEGRKGVVLANQSKLYRSESFGIEFRQPSDSEASVREWAALAEAHGYRPDGLPQSQRTPFGTRCRMRFVTDSTDARSRDIPQR